MWHHRRPRCRALTRVVVCHRASICCRPVSSSYTGIAMTGNVRDNCYPHIRLLPTYPHLLSADFICLLPVATSTHPLINHSLANNRCGVWLYRPFAGRPLACSPPGSFTPWLIRPWLVHPLCLSNSPRLVRPLARVQFTGEIRSWSK